MVTIHSAVLTNTRTQTFFMKTKLLITLISTLIFAIACTRNPDLSDDAAKAAGSGTWRVSLLSERGTDDTPDFSGYGFTFSSNGIVTAINGAFNKSGTWSAGSKKFNIDLGPKDNSNKPFGQLTDDWQIISVTTTEITLTDDNTTTNKLLTFTKN